MFLSKVYNFITVNIETHNYFEIRKKMMVVIFLYIAAIILVLFAFINFFVYEKIMIATIDSFASLIAIYSLFKLKNPDTLNIAINISSANIFIFFLVYLMINQNIDNGLIWIIFLPIFMIPLNGHNRGLLISAIFYIIAFIISYNGIDIWQNGDWNTHSYIRFVASSIVLVYITYVNELAIYRSNVQLNKNEKEKRLYIQQLQEKSDKDYLTNLYNRRKINSILEIQRDLLQQENTSFCIAILDIDFFKRINDNYGHNTGDAVLIEFSHIINNIMNNDGFVGRWGGEEFILIFTNTKIDKALDKCEEIRQKIENNKFDIIESITCSIGLVEYKDRRISLERMIDNADKSLYEAKESGRNKVVVKF